MLVYVFIVFIVHITGTSLNPAVVAQTITFISHHIHMSVSILFIIQITGCRCQLVILQLVLCLHCVIPEFLHTILRWTATWVHITMVPLFLPQMAMTQVGQYCRPQIILPELAVTRYHFPTIFGQTTVL
jgi:hypothetical protein